MLFKKVIRQIHLWLGLISGLIVFIIAITGTIWTFESEISDIVYNYRMVEPQNKSFVSISKIKEISKPFLDSINCITFSEKDRSIEVLNWERTKEGKLVNNYIYLNPYTGEILKVRTDDSNFFDIVLELHTNLLLGNLGHTIVQYATLVFLVMLVSGIILWWPKNKSARKQRFSFKWKDSTKWKRKNYDLHNILGFYSSWIIIFVTLTGLAWSFQWMDKAIYYTSTLGTDYKEYQEIKSKSDSTAIIKYNIEDVILQKSITEHKIPYKLIYFYLPQKASDSYRVFCTSSNTLYNAATYYFDQRDGKLLYTEKLENLNNGQTLRNMYYDIHIGKILGFPGQLAVFFASLIVASLPVTGFLIWWGRNRKK